MPCHTKPCFQCLGTELFNYPESREMERKSWYFSWKGARHSNLKVIKALLRSAHGILSRYYGVLLSGFSALSWSLRCALKECHGNFESHLFFEHAQSVWSFGVLGDPTAPTGVATALLGRCLRSYWGHLSVLYFSWTLWHRCENAALVWRVLYRFCVMYLFQDARQKVLWICFCGCNK